MPAQLSHVRFLNGPPTLEHGKILAPVDFSECARQAVDYAASLAKSCNAELMLVHIVDPYLGTGDLLLDMARMQSDLEKQAIDELQSWAKGVTPEPRVIVRIGRPAHEIIDAAEEFGVAAIVMSSHGRSAIARLFMGNIAQSVLRHAKCPVIILPWKQRFRPNQISLPGSSLNESGSSQTQSNGGNMNKSLEPMINSHPFFHGMKPQHLTMLYKGAKEARYRAGESLFHEGEPANRFFLVMEGNVVLEAHEPADGTAVVQCVVGGDVIGWSWLFPPFTWHLRARALEPTRTIVLDGAHLLSLAEAHHEFGYELMKRVAQVVIQRLQASRRQLLEVRVEEALQS